MNKSVNIYLGIAALLLAAGISNASTPNFIIIFADDLGYGDLGCYGAQDYQTPELDRMAQEGMRFTDFSVSDSICTPSRAGLLTGRYAQRWGYKRSVYFPWSNDGMPQSEITIAEVLKAEGYQTALIGKWHLGHKEQYLPTHQGFDSYFGIPYSNDMTQDGNTPLAKDVIFNDGMTREDYRTCRGSKAEIKKVYDTFKDKVPLMRGTEVIEWPVDQSQLTKRYTEAAVDFIRTNQEKPFFLYLAHAMPHIPLYASEAFSGKTERGIFGDVIEELDWSVGQVLQTLRETGLDKNTLVIFTSDNGPWAGLGEASGSAGPLRGAKFTSYEGGHRVPCIAWQPGQVPAGKVNGEQICTLDLLPTFARLAGTEPPADRKLDGLDIREALKGGQAPARSFTFYRDGQAIRVGDWKYRKGKKVDGLHGVESPVVEQLFNLKADVSESRNLIARHPEKAEELAARLQQEKAELGAIKPFAKRLQPAVRNSGYRDNDYWVWCGSAIKGEDGKYHMFASRWTKKVPFGPNWVTNSRIVRAVSDTPEGPYRYVEDVLPPRDTKYFDGRMTHNPAIHYIDGQYVLFYVGTTYNEPIPESGISRELYRKARANQRIGMATAESIEGPWIRRDEPVLDVRPDKWDALLTTNPAVTVMPDGRILLLYKSTKNQGTRLLYGAAVADQLDGPYRRLSEEPIFNASNDPKVNVEDLYVWQEDGVLQAVFKDMNGHLCGEKHAGVHAWSTDGMNWKLVQPAKAYSRDLLWDDGTVTHQGSLERPQLLIQDAKPTHLFMATTDGAVPWGKAKHTFNIAIPLQAKHP